MRFETFKNARIVRSSWLEEGGRRLDCNPYMSGALEARDTLRFLTVKKQLLSDLVEPNGLYKGKLLKRRFVQSQRTGIPFLTTSGMLQADLRDEPLLARSSALLDPGCIIQHGHILISAAGSIGRMTFCGNRMVGMFASSDILKVKPCVSKIRPGYLYAFLSGRFGLPIVVGGTYGAIVQHINPEHLAGLPVPRFGESFENEVSTLVETASINRDKADNLISNVAKAFDDVLVPHDAQSDRLEVNVVNSSKLQIRMDAQFHGRDAQKIRDVITSGTHCTIENWCSRIFLPGIFKRIHTETDFKAAPYYLGGSLFWNEPEPKAFLSRKTSLFHEVELKKGMVLVQAFGQEGGLTGKPVWVGDLLDSATTTHMLVRLLCNNVADSAYLFGFLSSQAAYRQIRRLPFGGSIPHFDEAGIKTVVMPLFSPSLKAEISQNILLASTLRDQAISIDRKARSMIEDRIKKN